MNPQPVKTGVMQRYSGDYGEDYLSYELENEAAFLRLQMLALADAGFDRIEKHLFLSSAAGNMQTREPPHVLDIGCATGALLAHLKERGWRVTGVEISPAAGYARNRRGIDVRSLPLEENNFTAGTFDIVHASHLIEHINDPHFFLKEVCRVLKPQGHIFISTPNIAGLQARLFGGRWRSAIFDHLFLFSAGTLKMLLTKTGFMTESINTWGGLAAGTVPMLLKKPADILAKRLGFGDVMIVRARKR